MTQRLLTSENFETAELCLATTLLYLGYPLVEIYRDSPKSVFVFRKTPALEEAIEAYWLGNIRTEPKQWFNAQREIKSRLYGTS